MVVVGQVRFEFGMEDEHFAFGLYRRWDDFCRSAFMNVADRILTGREEADAVLQIDRLELDLGVLGEEEFYRKFPLRLADCLEEALRSLIQGAGSPGVKRCAVSVEYCHQLMYYLLHGYLGYGNQGFVLDQILLEVLKKEAENFRCFLLAEGHRDVVRKRLICRLDDAMLESLVTLTVSGEDVFINRYTGFLIRNYPRLQHCRIPRQAYREALWMLVLAYIWSLNRGYVSRKELVRYTLRGLAACLGIGVFVLLDWLTRNVGELLAGDPVRHELLEILEEIRFVERLDYFRTGVDGVPEEIFREIPPEVLKRIFPEEAEDWMAYLHGQLADGVKRRKLLQGLQEADIELLVKIVVPADWEFVVSYARTLETEKEKGMYEGKAGGEFRYVKWDFIFAVLVERSFANLDRRQFVGEVLRRLASHYGLDYGELVEYFKKMPEELPGWLVGVLGELDDEVRRETIDVLKQPENRITQAEEKQLLEILRHPLSCRRLLSRLNDKEIAGLVKRFLPHDEGFILDYADNLSAAKEQGMFEGRAGGEFTRLKWEFIFQLALTDVFNRKYFVLAVLQELAAHYALDVKDLLDYFYHYLADEKEGIMAGLWQTLEELWQETEKERLVAEPALRSENDLEWRLSVLERFLLTGEIIGEAKDIYKLFMELKTRVPERLRDRIGRIPPGALTGKAENNRVGVELYAALLLWWAEGHPFPEQMELALNGMLQAALTGSGKVEVQELRLLLACCLEGHTKLYQKIKSGQEKVIWRFSEKDLPVLWLLISAFRRKEVADFIRSCKKEWENLIFAASPVSRKFLERLVGKAEGDRDLAVFLHEVFGIELPEKEKGIPAAGTVDPELLRQCLPGYRGTPEQRERLERWRTDRRVCHQVLKLLENDPVCQRIWIERVGNVGLHRLANELLALEQRMNFGWDKDLVWGLLAEYTLPEYANLAVEELYLVFVRKLLKRLPQRERERLAVGIREEKNGFGLWKNSLRRLAVVAVQQGPEKKEVESVLLADMPVVMEVHNAGLVLFSPWFVQLFHRLGLLDAEGKVFTGVEAQVRGVFVLQALVDGTGEKDYEEYELFLNRLLVGLPAGEVLPPRLELKEEEKELVESLEQNLRTSWHKLKNTSAEGLRQSFLWREGLLEEQEKEWKLTVSPQGVDVLLDSLPWGFSVIRLPWMEKRVGVAWRG